VPGDFSVLGAGRAHLSQRNCSRDVGRDFSGLAALLEPQKFKLSNGVLRSGNGAVAAK